jgi:hypothetical protein
MTQPQCIVSNQAPLTLTALCCGLMSHPTKNDTRLPPTPTLFMYSAMARWMPSTLWLLASGSVSR